ADAPAVGPLTITREAAHAEAIRNSPDVIEADANVRAAEAAIAEARRVRDPDLSVQASHAHTTDPTTYSDLTTLNLSMDLPLGGGTVARQQLKQAQAMLEQAKATREIALQSLDLAVEQAFLDFEANLSNVESAKETVRIAEESYQKAVQAYAAGLTTTRDVLDAGFALATARNDLNTAVYDLALSRAKLDQVIGREPKP
ncbi:MAG: outer membrane protein, partial [Fimbriimonadaceae bacterium]|nr:outer membrane protein [Fimbriimonadaceae bacterium]